MKKTKDIFMYAFATLITVAILGLIYLLIMIDVPEGNKDVLNLVIGALIGSFITIVTFFFGSSKSSAEKTEIIANGNKVE